MILDLRIVTQLFRYQKKHTNPTTLERNKKMKPKTLLVTAILLLVLINSMNIVAFADHPLPTHLSSITSSNQTHVFYDYTSGGMIYVPNYIICSRTSYRISQYTRAVQLALTNISEHNNDNTMNPNGIDNVYGDGTYYAVYAYQHRKYILGILNATDVDGDTGPLTWPLLEGDYRTIVTYPY